MVGLLATALILFSAFRADKPVITIFMIGDSTMANKKIDGGNPERGWGMVLPGFFSEDIRIDNHAANGRSSKSFISEGRWEKVISKEERNTETLQYTVRKVYRALKDTEEYISRRYNYIDPLLPDDIFFLLIFRKERQGLFDHLTQLCRSINPVSFTDFLCDCLCQFFTVRSSEFSYNIPASSSLELYPVSRLH